MTKHHLIIAAGVLGSLALTPAAFAGQPPRSDLNPPPPDIYTCQSTGLQTICRASSRTREDPVVTDVDCPGFQIVDQGDVATERTRRYDANGNFVERVTRETWTNAFWSNPLNGNTIPYTQRGITTDRAAVPGDLDSITETLVGENIYTDPITHKTVMKVAGRTVFAPDGNLEFMAGQQPFIQRFVFGDPSAFDALCAALAQ